MMAEDNGKVIIVEGTTDKQKIAEIIDEDVTIICTNGSLSIHRFDELLETYDLDYNDVYILVDEDKRGLKIRKQLSRELPHAVHMNVSSGYREVAKTPSKILASLLVRNHFDVDLLFLV